MSVRFHKVFLAMVLLKLLCACAPSLQTLSDKHVEPSLSDAYFQAKDGAMLPVKIWKNTSTKPKAIVLGLHGVNDYSNGFDRPARLWMKSDVWTYAFDQRGFGDTKQRGIWAGNDLYQEDAIEAAKLLKKKFPDVPLYLAGESMGGAVAIMAATSVPVPKIDGYILIAPAVLALDEAPWYQRVAMRGLAYTVPWWEPSMQLKITPSDNREMLIEWSKDPLVLKKNRVDLAWHLLDLMSQAESRASVIKGRTLILYGEKEDVVPDFSIKRFLENLPSGPDKNWKLIKYKEGYHMLTRDVQGDKVNQDILDFILEK